MSKPLPPEYHNRKYPDPNDIGRLSSGKFNLKQYKQAQHNVQEEEEKDSIPEDIIGSEESETLLRDAVIASAIPVPEDGKPIEPEAKEIKEDDHYSRGNKFNLKKYKKADSPPGWGGTVEKMKERHSDEIDNPFGLANWMKNKGDKPHYTEKGEKKEEFKDMPRGMPKKKR